MDDSTEPAPSILVVDDDDDVRRSLEKGLRARGYGVVLASDAGEAEAILGDPNIEVDIAVIDLVLPDGWGPQLTTLQSRHRPDLKVIYISGHGADDAVLQASSEQSRDVTFLAKPFEMQELVALIDLHAAGQEPGVPE